MDEVVVTDYDPRWPALYVEEAETLRPAFRTSLIALEHVGSTAVPGLAARPVIEIQAVVRTIPEAQEAAPGLAKLGYEQGIFARDPERRLLFKKFDAEKLLTHHLHIYEPDHPAASEHLLFRDYLRRCPEEARRYLDLKRELAYLYRHDRVAYSHAKTGYVNAVLAKAKSL